MGTEKKKKNVIILSVLLTIVLIVIVIVAGILITDLIKKHGKSGPDTTDDNSNSIFSNSYNEAIAKQILTTDNYTGSYVYDGCVNIYFNEKSDSNPNGLTQEEIHQIMADNGCRRYEVNELKTILSMKKQAAAENEVLKFTKPMNDETGASDHFGYYRRITGDKTYMAKVYGDENLAVVVSDSDESVYTFISLNYDKMSDAIAVSETIKAQNGYIYLFENTYDENGRLLYTVTYLYKIASAS